MYNTYQVRSQQGTTKQGQNPHNFPIPFSVHFFGERWYFTNEPHLISFVHEFIKLISSIVRRTHAFATPPGLCCSRDSRRYGEALEAKIQTSKHYQVYRCTYVPTSHWAAQRSTASRAYRAKKYAATATAANKSTAGHQFLEMIFHSVRKCKDLFYNNMNIKRSLYFRTCR